MFSIRPPCCAVFQSQFRILLACQRVPFTRKSTLVSRNGQLACPSSVSGFLGLRYTLQEWFHSAEILRIIYSSKSYLSQIDQPYISYTFARKHRHHMVPTDWGFAAEGVRERFSNRRSINHSHISLKGGVSVLSPRCFYPTKWYTSTEDSHCRTAESEETMAWSHPSKSVCAGEMQDSDSICTRF